MTVTIAATPTSPASDSDYSLTTRTLTFTGATAQTFRFAATDDDIDDDGEQVKLTFGTNLGTKVSTGANKEAIVSIDDNDFPVLTASYSPSRTTAAESDETEVTITVTLSAVPERAVNIPTLATHQGGASADDYTGKIPDTLAFGIGDTTNTFSITIVDDELDDDDESIAIRFDTSEMPERITPKSGSASSVISITDDDDPAVTVSFEMDAYAVAETDNPATTGDDEKENEVVVTVQLSADPERTMIIPITKTGQGGLSSADYSGIGSSPSLTFDAGNTGMSLTFVAKPDRIDDDGESLKLTFGTMPDARVTAGTTAETVITITDDDDGAGITVSPTTLDIDEGDSGDYTIKLASQPTGPVTITISTPSGSTLTPDDSSITFSSTNWASPQTVTLTASDDNDSDDHTVVVTQTGSSTDDNYDGRTVRIPTVVINDDDIDVQFGATNYSTYENAAAGAMVTITLAEPAASTLIIPLLTSGTGNDGAMAQPSDWSGIPATVTFNSGNDTVTFEVFAVADTDPDPNEAVVITLGTLPNGAARGTPDGARVDLNNTEPGGDIVVEYTLAEQTMREGETITITARISRRSSSPVTVPIVTRGSKHFHFDEYSEVPGEFHFLAGQDTQSFEFTSIDDAQNDPDAFVRIGFHNLPDGVVAGVIDTTEITIEENDFNIKKTYGCNPDSGQIIILEETGNISQAGDTDFWKVDLDPWRVYIFEALGADSGVDVIGEDTHPGDLTLSDPDIVGSWNADRSTRHAQYGSTSVNNRNSIVVDRSHTAGVHQIEVGGNGGTGTYQIKVRVNNVCYEEDGVGYYHWFGGPDGYVLDMPADTSTNFTLRPHSRNIGDKATGGFLGDNPAWYWDQVPDEDWIAAELRTGYEYTIEISTSETYPLQHQATGLTMLGIHDHEGTIIPNTASSTSGKQMTVVFRPTSTESHYISIGGGEDDRTGGYNIQISATADQTANQMSDNTESITASFSSSPEHHDGASKFQVRVEFSEDIETSYRDLPDAFTVEGGSMGTARRVNGSSSLWELDVTPASDDPVTITLAGSQDCTEDEAPCTSDGRTTGQDVSVQVLGPETATTLTANLARMPTEHSGSGAFSIWVGFSHDLRNSSSNLHERPTVAGGELESTSKIHGRADLWKFVIEPDGDAPVTFTLSSAPQCDAAGVDEVPCSQSGKPLSNTLSTTIRGPTLISVQGAEAAEGQHLTFMVSLSQPATEPVTMDYATGDGTATAGADYTARSGTITFLPGQQTHSVNVETLDDDAEEETETFTLTLSNTSVGRLTDATATGSITDDDPNQEEAARDAATDLGDITDTDSTTYSTLQSLDGEGQIRNWFTFSLTAQKRVQLGLRQLDADATITLEDQDGGTLESRSATGASSVRFSKTLQAGTYYVRVDAGEVAQNDYKLSWKAR